MMKKSVLSLMVGAAIFIAPLTASALTPMTADGLKDATGQAGVDISIDMIKIESWTGATTYTDSDGYVNEWMSTTQGPDNSASITIGGKHTTQVFNAITDGELSVAASMEIASIQGDAAFIPGTTANNTVYNTPLHAFIAMPLSIDVGTCRILSAGVAHNATIGDATTGDLDMDWASSNGFTFNGKIPTGAVSEGGSGPDAGSTLIAGVTIGIPTIEIITDRHDESYAITLNQVGSHNADAGQEFLSITKGNSVMAVCGGFLEIAPH